MNKKLALLLMFVGNVGNLMLLLLFKDSKLFFALNFLLSFILLFGAYFANVSLFLMFSVALLHISILTLLSYYFLSYRYHEVFIGVKLLNDWFYNWKILSPIALSTGIGADFDPFGAIANYFKKVKSK